MMTIDQHIAHIVRAIDKLNDNAHDDVTLIDLLRFIDEALTYDDRIDDAQRCAAYVTLAALDNLAEYAELCDALLVRAMNILSGDAS